MKHDQFVAALYGLSAIMASMFICWLIPTSTVLSMFTLATTFGILMFAAADHMDAHNNAPAIPMTVWLPLGALSASLTIILLFS